MDATTFIATWSASTLNERASSQQHFLDLCDLLGVPKPARVDPHGDFYTFEKLAAKETGRTGFADVWYQKHFAWEYKGPHKDLDAALQQVRQYSGNLGNPPVLVVSDMKRIRVVTQFTDYVTTEEWFDFTDIANPERRARLRALWTDTLAWQPTEKRDQVTEAVAGKFSLVAEQLRHRAAAPPERISHLLIRILFCLFAENIGLLPARYFSSALGRLRGTPERFASRLLAIFERMAAGGWDGDEEILHFNGGLFVLGREDLIPLRPEDLSLLWDAVASKWDSVAPAIFGTLFERGLDPEKRSQIGAHYTSEADIRAVVEPVVMAPLRRRWDALRGELETQPSAAVRRQALGAMLEAVGTTTVLDPACGSGNFLYVTLKLLHDLEYEVINWHTRHGLTPPFPTVGPRQVHGIEINGYAAELAQAVIWIGHLQWLLTHGYSPGDPVLQKLDNIVHADALLDRADAAGPRPTPWPAATCIVSNPPFLGTKRLRLELGDAMVDQLWQVYGRNVSRESDLVCYFVERAREQLATGQAQRVGLITTNSIRGGANRKVLERVKATTLINGGRADLFMGWADRPWILDGAAVRISMIGFDGGQEPAHTLDGQPVTHINPDLTTGPDLGQARRLQENLGIGFMGDTKAGPFDIDAATAQAMLAAVGNPNGRPNSDVVKPWMNGLDITRHPRNMWIIDFNDMSMEEAAMYEVPFEYVKLHVYPMRAENRMKEYKKYWWIHAAHRPGMRRALAPLQRYIATPTVAKHRVFAWIDAAIIPDHQLIVIARDDDYTFGVLHSRAHEVWSLKMCTWLGVGNDPRYTPTTTFETFPLPKATAGQRAAIAAAAGELARVRDVWLHPAEASAAILKGRTLTALYNAKPQWLLNLHAALDRAVFAAYGWPEDAATLSDDTIAARLLAENLARPAAGAAPPPEEEGDEEPDDEAEGRDTD